jgi:hypothetical protein
MSSPLDRLYYFVLVHPDGRPESLDVAWKPDSRGRYGRQTAAELGATPMLWEQFGPLAEAWEDAHICRPPERITEERYWHALEEMPPYQWRGDRSTCSSSFLCLEATTGNIHAIYCRIGEEYWEMVGRDTLTHAEIVAACLARAEEIARRSDERAEQAAEMAADAAWLRHAERPDSEDDIYRA